MPPSRKSTRLSGGAAKQSTLSFNHRVTKNIARPGKAGKDIAPKHQHVEDKAGPTDIKIEDVNEDSAVDSQQEPEPLETEAPAPEKSAAEIKAETITDKAIQRYWREQEKLRSAKRVHQEGLTTGEKVLRFFDVSSQYGVGFAV
jgi:DNA polymerase delta subunit 4